jgi:hypothetical protein
MERHHPASMIDSAGAEVAARCDHATMGIQLGAAFEGGSEASLSDGARKVRCQRRVILAHRDALVEHRLNGSSVASEAAPSVRIQGGPSACHGLGLSCQ